MPTGERRRLAVREGQPPPGALEAENTAAESAPPPLPSSPLGGLLFGRPTRIGRAGRPTRCLAWHPGQRCREGRWGGRAARAAREGAEGRPHAGAGRPLVSLPFFLCAPLPLCGRRSAPPTSSDAFPIPVGDSPPAGQASGRQTRRRIGARALWRGEGDARPRGAAFPLLPPSGSLPQSLSPLPHLLRRRVQRLALLVRAGRHGDGAAGRLVGAIVVAGQGAVGVEAARRRGGCGGVRAVSAARFFVPLPPSRRRRVFGAVAGSAAGLPPV